MESVFPLPQVICYLLPLYSSVGVPGLPSSVSFTPEQLNWLFNFFFGLNTALGYVPVLFIFTAV